jgi:DNA-binding PadR family transcriptional regulator
VEEKSSKEIKRAVLNRDAMVYPALRDLTEGGYLDCRGEVAERESRHTCSLTEKGKRAYLDAAQAWERSR